MSMAQTLRYRLRKSSLVWSTTETPRKVQDFALTTAAWVQSDDLEASVFALVRKPRASTIGLVANVQYVSCSSYGKTYIAILRVEALEGVFALAICERRNSRARTNLKKKSERHKAEGHQRLEARIRHDGAK